MAVEIGEPFEKEVVRYPNNFSVKNVYAKQNRVLKHKRSTTSLTAIGFA